MVEIQLVTTKKELLTMFGAKKGEMEQFMAKNKLSVKDDDAYLLNNREFMS